MSYQVEERKKSKGEEQHSKLAGEYRKAIEVELKAICTDILSLLDVTLIPHASSPELKVFFYKMKGDYYRYIAEFAGAEDRTAPTQSAEEAYEEATAHATRDLAPTHPIRLGLALNFSVFYYEIFNDPPRACKMARDAFDAAVSQLDEVAEESYKDSTLIMQLLRDNLSLWQSDGKNEADAVSGSVCKVFIDVCLSVGVRGG